mgnify:CR=1 FL=1
MIQGYRLVRASKPPNKPFPCNPKKFPGSKQAGSVRCSTLSLVVAALPQCTQCSMTPAQHSKGSFQAGIVLTVDALSGPHDNDWEPHPTTKAAGILQQARQQLIRHIQPPPMSSQDNYLSHLLALSG